VLIVGETQTAQCLNRVLPTPERDETSGTQQDDLGRILGIPRFERVAQRETPLEVAPKERIANDGKRDSFALTLDCHHPSPTPEEDAAGVRERRPHLGDGASSPSVAIRL
jgi:hypothetical protein